MMPLDYSLLWKVAKGCGGEPGDFASSSGRRTAADKAYFWGYWRGIAGQGMGDPEYKDMKEYIMGYADGKGDAKN